MKVTIPTVVFKTRIRDESIAGDNPFRWQDVSSDDIFKGKKVVIWLYRVLLHQRVLALTCLDLKKNTSR